MTAPVIDVDPDKLGGVQAQSWTVRETCRLCSAPITPAHTVLELAPTPPANELVLRADDPPQELIPLYLARCPDCGHVQLPVVVDPERLFRNYVYVSATSPSFVEHFARYAEACVEQHQMRAGDLVVDIGSNDGTMLFAFKLLGMDVQGVDPAKEIAARATKAGVETWPEFFTRDTAQKIKWAHGKPARLVVANNVFAHADDLKSIVLGVRDLLDPRSGRFVFEVQYLVDLVDKTLFDMVYHEHLSYHSLAPLVRFFDGLGMTLIDAECVPTHGGSVRCTAAPGRGDHQSDRLRALLQREAERLTLSVDPFGDLRRRIDDAGEKLRNFITEQRQLGKEVTGYGAPAKLTTLCHQFGITGRDISYVVDDSEWKQGMMTPGTRIPIVSGGLFSDDPPDSVVIFAWNFAEPIAKKLRAGGFGGRIVAPLPAFVEL